MKSLVLSDSLSLGSRGNRYRTFVRNDSGLVAFRTVNSDCWGVMIVPTDQISAGKIASMLPDWPSELIELPNRTHVWARWRYVENGFFHRVITLALLAIGAWDGSKLAISKYYPPLRRLLQNPVVPETNHYFSEHLLGGSAVDLPPHGQPIEWPVTNHLRLMWDHHPENE